MYEEEEVPTVPTQFALKSLSNQKYLSLVRKDNELFGHLQFSGDKVTNPHTKFELEPSKFGKGYFHVRCCSNNRYWVLRSQSSHYILAGATKPDEDQSKPTCTLFKPIHDASAGSFRFRTAYLSLYLHLRSAAADGAPSNSLFAKSSKPETDRSDLVTTVDWESLCFLPRYVAFKGHNGRYLRPMNYYSHIYPMFHATDLSDPAVKHEIVQLPDGHVRIKNIVYNKYWYFDTNWIAVTGDENSASNRRTWFWPIRVDNGGVVAFRSMGNNHICESLSVDGKENCLNANASGITGRAKIEVQELVLSREIYDINFRMSSARIYDEKPLVMATGTVENLKDVADKLSVKLSYEDTVISTWNSKISVSYGVKMTAEFSGTPRVSGGEIEVYAQSGEEYEWGETLRTKTIVEVTHDVVAPPWTKVKGSIIATQASYDVPFSYTQKDRLMNGKLAISRLDDGVFTGVNYYNFQFVAEPI